MNRRGKVGERTELRLFGPEPTLDHRQRKLFRCLLGNPFAQTIDR